jgi:hypothetical protein
MKIGYNPKDLWRQIAKKQLEISDEADWLNHYAATEEIDCVEDCVKNIEDSLIAIKECLEHLKGETL